MQKVARILHVKIARILHVKLPLGDSNGAFRILRIKRSPICYHYQSRTAKVRYI